MKRVGGITATATGALALISAVAALGRPALAVVAFLGVLVIGAVCWVVADRTRAQSLALLIDVALGGDRRRPPR